MSEYHLAQLNIARLRYPLDAPELADFVNSLDRVNALAEQSPGFVWRLQTASGDATEIDHFGADQIVNMSVWKSIERLHHYVYRSAHLEVMRRKREWFHTMEQAHMVLWWVPAGHRPTLEEAENRLQALRENGATPRAFTFKHPFPAPDAIDEAAPSRLDAACPGG